MNISKIKLPAIFLALLILPSVISVVYAHPGKTDSDGGHVDHSTGEYHYHHGYSAHDHYDMDGDYVVDCPYDFNDLTDHSPGTSSAENKSSSGYKSQDNSYNYMPKETIAVSTTKVVTKDVPYFPLWAKWTVIISVFVSACLIFANHSQKKQIAELEHKSRIQISELEKQHHLSRQKALSQMREDNELALKVKNKEIQKLNTRIFELQTALREKEDRMNSEFQKTLSKIQQDSTASADLKDEEIKVLATQISELQDELCSIISTLPVGTVYFPSVGHPKQQLYRIEIPSEIYFINGTVPVRGFISDRTPYGDFTVYVAQKGRCYHTDPHCGNGLLYAKHAYDTVEKLPPCKVCGYRFSEPVPEWYFQIKGIPSNFHAKTAGNHSRENHYEQLNIDFYTQS